MFRHPIVDPRTALFRLFFQGFLSFMVCPREALTNGRFPTANYFIAGPGTTNQVLTLRTTFGLVVSRDAGRSWGWICEEGYGAVSSNDPSFSIGPDGNLVIATFNGMFGADPAFCAWERAAGTTERAFVDVAHTADNRAMVALAGPPMYGLFLSGDGGRRWTAGASLAGYFAETADVAPSDPTRVYVTAYGSGAVPVLLRSDDGGRTVRETTRNFDGADGSGYLAAVDPHRPDVLYLRANLGIGTILLKSVDGGMTFTRIGQTATPMLGFALSDDGDTVWISGSDRSEGIRRSVRGGPWARVGGDVSVQCLRYHAGLLFVCADEVVDGYALGCSRDGGEHVDPLVSLRRLTGVSPVCDGTPVGRTCGPAWAMQTMALRSIDAGPPREPVIHGAEVGPEAGADASDDAPGDAGTDAGSDVSATDLGTAPDVADVPGVDAVDAPAMDARADAGSTPDAGPRTPPPPPDGCSCRAGVAGGSPTLAALVAGLTVALRRRRRGGAPPRPTEGRRGRHW